MVGKYQLSPYMACEHGCAYCDGRAEKYFVEGDFDTDVVVRTNLPGLLGTELPKLREKGFVTVGSGITDSYQPIEAETGLMRKCAQVLAEYRQPVAVLTKSALALRDIDLWSTVNEKSRFLFMVSLVHPDDSTREIYEPGASTVEQRLDALRRFKEAGCATGMLAMPLLPGITDAPEAVRRLYELAMEVGVDFVMPGGLTLRPGRQKEFFFTRLRQNHPNLLDLYRDIYREERASGSPINSYMRDVMQRSLELNDEYCIPANAPHRIYRRFLHRYDEVHVLLCHMADLYHHRRVDTRPLLQAHKRYVDWLTARKALYNRRPSWQYENLDAELLQLCEADESTSGDRHSASTPPGTATPSPRSLTGLIGNARLAAFLRRVIVNRDVFDYVTLETERAPE